MFIWVNHGGSVLIRKPAPTTKGMVAPVIIEAPQNQQVKPVNASRNRRFTRIPGDQIGAVIVGINEYSDPSWRLRKCVQDAQNMRRLLIDAYGVPANQIKTLYNEGATKHNIIREMRRVNEAFEYRFYGHSGHGYRVFNSDAGKYVEGLCVYGQTWCRAGMLLDADIYTFLGNPARTWLMIDACHSGGLLDKGGNPHRIKAIVPPGPVKLGRDEVPLPKDFVGMFACMARESAYEDGAGGVFATNIYNLLLHKPELSYNEVQNLLRERVTTNQTPQFIAPDLGVGLFEMEESWQMK